MFVAHLQLPIGHMLSALNVKRLIWFIRQRDSFDVADMREACREATHDAHRDKLINQYMSFVNFGSLSDIVQVTVPGDCGLVVSTRLALPAVFHIIDDYVRIPGINFDFQDETNFRFDKHAMKIESLTETDKTLLRLSSSPIKLVGDNGEEIERVRV